MKAPRKLTFLSTTILVLCLFPLALAQNEPSEDEASLAALVKSYYAASGQKDLGALVRLWSQRSPDLAVSIAEALNTLDAETYTFSNLLVSRVRVAGNKAILQVTTNVTITDNKTSATRQERSTRNFALIKEDSQWKVWRDMVAKLRSTTRLGHYLILQVAACPAQLLLPSRVLDNP